MLLEKTVIGIVYSKTAEWKQTHLLPYRSVILEKSTEKSCDRGFYHE